MVSTPYSFGLKATGVLATCRDGVRWGFWSHRHIGDGLQNLKLDSLQMTSLDEFLFSHLQYTPELLE